MLRLTRVRKELGVSQLKIAMKTGISPSDLSAVENGHKKAFPGWKKRIAAALGVEDVNWLFDEDEASMKSEASV